MNRNSLFISSALAMSCMPFGMGVNEIPLRMYDFDSITRDFGGSKPWGGGGSYYKRPKNKATIARRKANKAARKARK